MVPIVSVSDLANGFISAIIGLWLLARQRGRGNLATSYFIVFYFLFSFAWFCWAAPEIVTQDPWYIMWLNIIGYLALYAAIAVMVQLPFLFLNRQGGGAIAGMVVVVAGIVFLLGRLLNLQPHVRELVDGYVFWSPVYAAWLRIFTGVVAGLTAALCAIVFMYLGWRGKNDVLVYKRSVYLAIGMLIILVATSVSYILFFFFSFFWTNLLGSALVIVGLLLLLHGILYEGQRND